MSTLDLGPALRATSARSRLKVWGSTSHHTGVAPRRATEPAVAKKVKAGSRTSSPGPTSRAINPRRRASVPEETPKACLTLSASAQDRSKASSSGPIMNWLDPKTLSKAARRSAAKARFCGPKSRRGTGVIGQKVGQGCGERTPIGLRLRATWVVTKTGQQ